MVGREDIANAVALNSAMFNGARIVGPAIAGLAIYVFSLSYAFLINGLSFLAVIVAYLSMRDDDLHSPARYNRPSTVAEVRRTLGEGLTYVRRTEIVLMTTVLVGLMSTFGMNFGVMIPALANEVLHTDAMGFGLLMTASGVGAMAAALLIAFSGRQRPVIIPAGGILLGVGLIIGASINAFAWAIPAMVIVGFGAIGMAATANTTIQLAVPDELRGRVISVYTTVFVGSTPIGGLIIGWIASRYGVDASLLVGGIACIATGGLGLIWLRRINTRRTVRTAGRPTAPEATTSAETRPG
jgi:MFS family permease